MSFYICEICGVQYAESHEFPPKCKICTEERQYVHPSGQSWTTLEKMRASKKYQNNILQEEKNLYSITTTPEFAIGQTAYLIQTNGFNVLWDCITYLDQKMIDRVKELGGIQAIALSHPHYYSTQAVWAEVFDAPIYIHEDDKEWVMRPSEKVAFWTGESMELENGIILHRLGGHFKGGAVLEWQGGCEQKGVLLSGDIIQVTADRSWVSFMYSYPNLIPLPAKKVQEIAGRTSKIKFDKLYNAFHRVVESKADDSVQKSAERYVLALEGKLFQT